MSPSAPSPHASSTLRHFRHPVYGIIQMLTALIVALQPVTFVSGDDPPPYSISLSADTNPVESQASTNLHALLWNNTADEPVAGANVEFSIVSGDGTLGSYQAVTDSAGVATVTFTGGSSTTEVRVADAMGYGAETSGTMQVAAPPPHSAQLRPGTLGRPYHPRDRPVHHSACTIDGLRWRHHLECPGWYHQLHGPFR